MWRTWFTLAKVPGLCSVISCLPAPRARPGCLSVGDVGCCRRVGKAMHLQTKASAEAAVKRTCDESYSVLPFPLNPTGHVDVCMKELTSAVMIQ